MRKRLICKRKITKVHPESESPDSEIAAKIIADFKEENQ